MQKTSVYLPERLKARLADLARRTGRSEANLVRLALERLLDGTTGPVPGAAAEDVTTPSGRRRAGGARLVGVGVGPGDADLVTVRALAALRRADRVFAPVTSIDAVGRAEAVVREAAPDIAVERLVFAMTPDPAARRAALEAATDTIAAHLANGEEVAFVTIGDPNVYSTFTSIAQAVRARDATVAIVSVPGIMAFQDLAARSGTVLVDERQALTLVTALDGMEPIAHALSDPDRAVVVYKGGRHLPDLAATLREVGRVDGAVMGELLGLPGERVVPVAQAAQRPASYLATVIVPPVARRIAGESPGEGPAAAAGGGA